MSHLNFRAPSVVPAGLCTVAALLVALIATPITALAQDSNPASPVAAALKQAHEAHRQKRRDEARALFAQVAAQFPGTTGGAEASWMVAYFHLNDKQFAAAATLFQQVANASAADPAIASEALLQTGFIPISRYWASHGTERDKQALLVDALGRLSQIARGMGMSGGQAGQTARAFAASGAGEVLLLQGRPGQAEAWYRFALSRPAQVELTALTLATYGLGVALYRQGRYAEALRAFTEVTARPTGLVLRGLLVSPALPAKAALWRAATLSHLGQAHAALAAIDDCLRDKSVLEQAAGGKPLLAQAEDAKGRLRQDIQVAQEREELLKKAKTLAANAGETPLRSLIAGVANSSMEEAR